MKILCIGYHNPHYLTVTEYIERAVAALGHELHVFDTGRRMLPGRLRQPVPALERLDQRWLNGRLAAFAAAVRPELVIASGGDLIEPATVRRLRASGARTVLWTTDAPIRFDPILRIAPHFDRVFCQGSEAVELFERAGIGGASWLPMACDPCIHAPEALTGAQRDAYAHDVVFVGSHYPVREALFEALADFDLAIWGPGWERVGGGSPLRGRIRGAHTPPEVWRKLYSAARVVLATHFQDPAAQVPVYQASPRVFEAMACGALVVVDRQRDVETLFRDGEHVMAAEGKAELREKVKLALSRPRQRHRIAAAGRREVLARHTYTHRVQTLLALLNRGPGEVGAA